MYKPLIYLQQMRHNMANGPKLTANKLVFSTYINMKIHLRERF